MYGNEAWTICKSDRITTAEMKCLRRTAGYTKLDKKKRNTDILRELKINSALQHTDQYSNKWKHHVQKNGPESYSSTNVDQSSKRQKIP
jgi:hypothetical protein